MGSYSPGRRVGRGDGGRGGVDEGAVEVKAHAVGRDLDGVRAVVGDECGVLAAGAFGGGGPGGGGKDELRGGDGGDRRAAAVAAETRGVLEDLEALLQVLMTPRKTKAARARKTEKQAAEVTAYFDGGGGLAGAEDGVVEGGRDGWWGVGGGASGAVLADDGDGAAVGAAVLAGADALHAGAAALATGDGELGQVGGSSGHGGSCLG